MIPSDSEAGKPPLGIQDSTPAQHPDFWEHAVGSCAQALAAVEAGEIGEWTLPFEIARAIRGHEQADRHKPAAVAKKLFKTCRSLADSFTEEDFVTQFPRAWNKVRLLPGIDPLTTALRFATENPLRLVPEHECDATPGYKQFISLCGWLCVVVGSDRIKIPCRKVSELLDVRPMTVSCWRERAEEHGYLTVSKKHVYRPGGKGQATEFIFPVDRWKILVERMPKV